jgi:hypothetical protein
MGASKVSKVVAARGLVVLGALMVAAGLKAARVRR